jgi:hypothetical protein
MANKNAKIWIWMHNGKILKAIAHPNEGIFAIYDEHDNLLIKRTGLTIAQIKKIEITMSTSGVKRVDGHREPFTYL